MRVMNPAQRALFEKRGRRLVGRDPRQVSRDELVAAGHGAMSVFDALRSRCLDCTADAPDVHQDLVSFVAVPHGHEPAG